jgi:hypothetical protein
MNVLLINFHEMEINHLVQLIYYLSKMGYSDFNIDPKLLSEQLQAKLGKI